MAKPKLPNMKNQYAALGKRLGKYMTGVQNVYSTLASEASRLVLERTSYDGTEPFLFSLFPEISKGAKELQTDFAHSITSFVTSCTATEWRQSNIFQDQIAGKAIKFYTGRINGRNEKIYYQTNSDALKAFQQRQISGMNLSKNVWQQSEDTMRELEGALSVSIEKGVDAVTVSKRVSKYLKDFPALQKDYKEQFGEAKDIHDCEYRSIRLARSEINMAYRMAEQERWQQFDFIKGYEVKTSGSHPLPDICDDLAGQYPKDFVFLGWHPNCMCYVVPIVMSEDEYDKYQDEKDDDPDAEPQGYIKDTPDKFKEYVQDNKERIAAAQERGTAPYWVRDNSEYMQAAMNGEVGQPLTILERAAQRHANRTPQETAAIKEAWAERQAIMASPLFDTIKLLQENKVEANEIQTLSKAQKQEKSIISRISGLDRTSFGSCASVALAFMGNKSGYNVLDFRGGVSREIFAKPSTLEAIIKKMGGIFEKEKNEFTTASKLLSNVQQKKEYFFYVGEHAAIVRKTAKGLEYLELQGYAQNDTSVTELSRCGYHPLNKERLAKRFKCKRSHMWYGINISPGGGLIDINLLCKDKGFKKLLEFINTSKTAQLKGAGGSIK